MLKNMKKDLWNILCVFWAMAVALFWFAMRVIWSGISKVLAEAIGTKEPSAFMLNLPLFISIFLWLVLVFAVMNLVISRYWMRLKRESLLNSLRHLQKMQENLILRYLVAL